MTRLAQRAMVTTHGTLGIATAGHAQAETSYCSNFSGHGSSNNAFVCEPLARHRHTP